MIDYEDLILQRQEAIELYDDCEDPDIIAELYPDLEIDFDEIPVIFED